MLGEKFWIMTLIHITGGEGKRKQNLSWDTEKMKYGHSLQHLQWDVNIGILVFFAVNQPHLLHHGVPAQHQHERVR